MGFNPQQSAIDALNHHPGATWNLTLRVDDTFCLHNDQVPGIWIINLFRELPRFGYFIVQRREFLTWPGIYTPKQAIIWSHSLLSRALPCHIQSVTIIKQGSLKLGEFTTILDSGHFTSSINNGEVVSTSKLGSSCSVKEDTGYTCDNQLQNGVAEDKS